MKQEGIADITNLPDRTLMVGKFLHSADLFSERVAVVAHECRLTYGELKSRSEHIAALLTACGVRQGSIVGLYLDGGIEYLTAVFGIMQAGAVFFPINTHFPKERVRAAVAKVAPDLIITRSDREMDLLVHFSNADDNLRLENVASFSDGVNLYLTLFALKTQEIVGRRSEERQALAPDACYLLCTSGSTGEPKLILGSEKGLDHFIAWETKEFGISEDVRVPLLAPVSFDVSLRDIFIPLLSGGILAIPDKHTKQDPAALFQWIKRNEITHIHMVPTLFRLLTDECERLSAPERSLPNLKHILIAGESLYGDDISAWRRVMGIDVELVNLYGPSETTLAKCFYRIKDDECLEAGEIVPLGRPLPDTDILIARNGELCPPGALGEIYIKTPFRSLGYFNDPELNRAMFLANPFVHDDHEVVYRTGDLGSSGEDGIIRFAGRKDAQAKLYGNRIDLGEIETTLRRHPAVRQAAAAIKRNNLGDERLIGYIVLKIGEPLSVESIGRFVRAYLPEYMVPALYVSLSSLPVTHNDKIDREGLPEPPGIRPELEQAFVPPSTELETCLSTIWCDVLTLDRVGVLDNFFDLGGTSVLAARVLVLIQEKTGREVPIVTFFQFPNVRLLAQHLATGQDGRPTMSGVQDRARRYRSSRRQRSPRVVE